MSGTSEIARAVFLCKSLEPGVSLIIKEVDGLITMVKANRGRKSLLDDIQRLAAHRDKNIHHVITPTWQTIGSVMPFIPYVYAPKNK
ncbi:MAG: hypothetical protein WKF37_10190 [Bryobacteraceae bacterium]